MEVVTVKAQVPTVIFLLILNTGADKGAHMSEFVEKREEDFVCMLVLVVLYVHKVLRNPWR